VLQRLSRRYRSPITTNQQVARCRSPPYPDPRQRPFTSILRDHFYRGRIGHDLDGRRAL
jgi:hypothetical protein